MWHRLVNIQNYRREQLAYSWLPKRSRNKFLLFSTSKVQVRVTGPHLKFMGALRTAAHSLFGDTCKAEYKVSKDAGFAVDFYFPNEKIAVEIALSLEANQFRNTNATFLSVYLHSKVAVQFRSCCS